MKKYFPYIVIFLTTILLFAPIFLNPNLLIDRGNDLQEQFWPVFYFIKQNIFVHHQIPLWNNLFFAGIPILSDPQFSLFYPFNFLFYFLPTSTVFIVHIFAHLFLGAIGMYLLTNKVLFLNKKASIFGAITYIFTPIVSGYLEAGHFTLIAAYAWLPFLVLSTILIIKKPKPKWVLLFAVSLAGLFYTHTLIFLSASVITIPLFAFTYFYSKLKNPKVLVYIIAGFIITFGLTAITFLPQMEWSGLTTRFLLITHPQVYPEWLTKKEFLLSIFLPWAKGVKGIWQIGTDKWVTLGTLPLILSIFGFFKLKKKYQIPILMLTAFVTILSLNNLLPFYSFFTRQNWFAVLRVTTRLWYVNSFITTLLATVAIDNLIKTKKKPLLINLIIFLTLGEILTYSWIYIFKPPHKNTNLAPTQVYEFLTKDTDQYRVFCTTRCLSQQESVKYNLQLIEGYNTLQQTNYFKQSWQLMGGFWNYYTLAVPPVDTSINNQIQPNAKALGEYNTKYIISPYKLTDLSFKLTNIIEGFYIYENDLFQPRANAYITIYTPNHIRLETNYIDNPQIILAEVYSPGWKAYLNGTEEVKVQETPNALRAVDIKPDTKFVDLVYKPNSYTIGKTITLATILILAFVFLVKYRW